MQVNNTFYVQDIFPLYLLSSCADFDQLITLSYPAVLVNEQDQSRGVLEAAQLRTMDHKM